MPARSSAKVSKPKRSYSYNETRNFSYDLDSDAKYLDSSFFFSSYFFLFFFFFFFFYRSIRSIRIRSICLANTAVEMLFEEKSTDRYRGSGRTGYKAIVTSGFVKRLADETSRNCEFFGCGRRNRSESQEGGATCVLRRRKSCGGKENSSFYSPRKCPRKEGRKKMRLEGRERV